METLKRNRTPDEVEATTLKRQRTPDEIEDIILRKIFLVTPKIDNLKNDSRLVFLEEPKLCRESMERVLIDRLSGDFADAEPPFTYLVECFRRASEEEKKIMTMKDKNVRSEIEMAVKQAKSLVVFYCRLLLGNPDMFPNRDSGNASPLLPLLFSEVATEVDVCTGIKSPTGFIGELFKEADYEILKPVLSQLFEDLRDSVVNVSALGQFQQPLTAFLKLINYPVGARILVDHLNGLSDNLNGREIETRSVLGAFLHVSGLPDHRDFKSLPDVGQECSSRPSSAADVKATMDRLQSCLVDVLTRLLNNKGFRENVLQFLALLINKNASRAQTQVDPLSCASSGTFVNLSAVMLRLCEPFMHDLTKRQRIDPRYVLSSRLEFRGLTAIHATSDQVSEWSKSGSTNQPEFSFICECFFMTARVLNLGLMKSLSHIKHLEETITTSKDDLTTLKAMHEKSPTPRLQKEIAELEKEIESYSQEIKCYQDQVLNDKALLRNALSFYRLMVVWMVDLAGGFKVPAPETCPMHFAAVPEHFVEDAMDLVVYASFHPALDGFEHTDFMNFIIMFMGSPQFIQNPYLRAKMVNVLQRLTSNKKTDVLFRGHQPALDHLVRNLLQFYADIESTGSHSQFYDKFNIRHRISTVLKYLWEIPGHRNAWKRIAREEKKGVYLQFLNFLMNDSIYLLDEGLNKITMKPEELDSREVTMVRANMDLANEDIDMICFTTEDIVAPFLVPEMVERVASMLNYFLAQLKSPALKESEKYAFQPRKLLRQIVKIYVNLARGDTENVFATAITKDGRSYSEQLFGDAAEVLRKNGEDAKMINDFLELGKKAKVATKQAEEAELALGEIPEEFMDPIMSTLMTDPVILPNTNVRIDRPVILRHLLSKNTDPFSGLPLTADMLIPETELKAKIDSFLRN